MKNNKVIIYSLIISIVIHSALILFLLKYDNKKIKKHLIYSKPITIEPYMFAKNLQKHKVIKPRYASLKPHFARKNTRLNAPPAHSSHTYASRRLARHQVKRTLSSSHLLSRVPHILKRHNLKLNSIYPVTTGMQKQSPIHPRSSIKNPSHGIKSANVNLNTTTIKYASYLLHVKNKIENVWEYPTEAKRDRISGQLTIEFSINSNGSIYKVRILNSSGKKSLDTAAVNAIKNATMYNRFPKSWTIKRLNIRGTFIYRLSNFYLY